MRIHNKTHFPAGWTQSFLRDGREAVTVVVKGTFSLRRAGEPSEQPVELFDTDVFGNEPARDAPLRENDFAPYKPRCDVLLQASAYAPGGRPVRRVEAGVAVGSMQKTFATVGPRTWRRGFVGVVPTAPELFDQCLVSYDTAFGGVDVDPRDPQRIHTFPENPSGIGYSKSGANVDGMPLPRTEELGRGVTDPSAHYVPMALGPVGRHWSPRASYAGTYDEQWQSERLPFLPDDFNSLYFQAAPADQQIDHPTGGERVALVNLCREGRLQTHLPQDGIVMAFINRQGDLWEMKAVCDTILIEPDADRLCMVWRAALPLRRDVFELREMIVARASEYRSARMRARLQGKAYYANLGDIAAARRKGRA